MKDLMKIVFVKGFLVIFLVPILCILYTNSYSSALEKDKVHLSLIGGCGSDNDIICVNLIGSDTPQYAYCGTNEGLIIFDIINPSRPKELSFLKYGDIYDISVFSSDKTSKKYAALACGSNGLVILDISDPVIPKYIGALDTSGSVYGVAVIGSYAYIVNSSHGFVIIDLLDPTNPNYAGGYNTGGAYDMAISPDGRYAYVADGGGLFIIDCHDPRHPNYAGEYNTTGVAQSVALSPDGRYAYVADGDNGLVIIDCHDPANPTYTGGYNTRGTAEDVALSPDGNYAYVADSGSGLIIVNCKDPTNPTYAGGYYTLYTEGIAISPEGRYVYVADGRNGLVIIDCGDNNPIGPAYSGEYDTIGSAKGVVLSPDGRYAYVADGDNGLVIIDCHDPANPTYTGVYNTRGTAEDVALSLDGRYAYVADGGKGLVIIDCQDPNHPTYSGDYHTPYTKSVDLSPDGRYAYVADLFNDLVIIDCQYPNNPTYAGGYDAKGSAEGIALSPDGRYAYMADGYKGLVIIDCQYPNNPTYAGGYDTIGYAKDIELSPDSRYAYVADDSNGLVITNCQDPTNPFYAGGYDLTGIAEGIAISPDGRYAYVANRSNGLVIIDCQDPTNPFYAGGYNTKGSAMGVVLSPDGRYAYVADDDNGLVVIDCQDSTDPIYAGGYETIWDAKSLAISPDGRYAYVTDGWEGLFIISYLNLPHPVFIGRYDTNGYAMDVALSPDGRYAYVADDYSLVIIDCQDPICPKYAGSYDTKGNSCGVAISSDGKYAYGANWSNGLVIIDCRDPNCPLYVGGYDTNGCARGIALSPDGRYAYVADDYNGLVIIDCQDPNLPTYVGGFETWSAQGVVISPDGRYAYVVDGSDIEIIDCYDPINPTYAGRYNTEGFASDLSLFNDGRYAYVADGFNGLVTLKINTTLTLKGNLLIVAGGSKEYSNPSWNATRPLPYIIHTIFKDHGYESYEINCFTPDPSMIREVDDPTPTKAELLTAITTWATDQFLNTGPLYIGIIGHGAEDRFQIMPNPNDILMADELSASITQFQEDTNRPVIILIESASSGSFIDDLSPDPADPLQGLYIITSTGNGPSYIKPSPDPNSADPDDTLPLSFTGLFVTEMGGYPLEDTASLAPAFIAARERLYDYGHPFLDQAPQMYAPGGPIGLFLAPDPDDPNTFTPEGSFALIHKDLALTPVALYKDGTTHTIPSEHLIIRSSDSSILDPDDPDQLSIEGDTLYLSPARNGIFTLIAYPDPVYSDILLTAYLPIDAKIDGNPRSGGNKAIIVAGYRLFNNTTDYLWSSTNTIANHAYMGFRKKGLGREDIFYHSYLDQDVDKNGHCDDIDGYPNKENLDRAFSSIEDTHAEELFILLVDHGNRDATFNINPGEDGQLKAIELAERICGIADYVKGSITLLIEACYSGSMIEPIKNAMEICDPNKIIIITSVDPDHEAKVKANGLISFAYPFIDEFILSNSLVQSYKAAIPFVCHALNQTPQVSSFTCAEKRDRSLMYYIDEARPIINQREYTRKENTLSIDAQVFSLAGIENVWAMIINAKSDIPVSQGYSKQDDFIIPLEPNEVNEFGGCYREQIEDPYPSYEYQIILYAKDNTGKVVLERTTIGNRENSKTGALLLVTDLTMVDQSYTSLAINKQSCQIYQILKEKEVDDIYYLKTTPYNTNEVLNGRPQDFDILTINTWFQRNDYDIVLIYLIGESETYNGSTCFKLDKTHRLSLSDLPSLIGHQGDSKILVFSEFHDAGNFYTLSLPQNWVGIGSPYIDFSRPLFSYFFFSRIYFFDTIGESLKNYLDSFEVPGCYSSCYIHFYDGFTTCDLNEIKSRLCYHIGSPALKGEYPFLIKDVLAIDDGTYLTLRLKANGFKEIDPNTVRAEIITVSGDIDFFPLSSAQDPTLYEYTLYKKKDYSRAIFYIEQIEGPNQPAIIDWREIFIRQSSPGLGPDHYEPDNSPDDASYVVKNLNFYQIHTFHDANDADWLYFYGHKDEQYEIAALSTEGLGLPVMWRVYDHNNNLIKERNFFDFISGSTFICPYDAYYTLEFSPWVDPSMLPFGYQIAIGPSSAPTPSADVLGRVIDPNGRGINGLSVCCGKKTETGSISGITKNSLDPLKHDGWFFISNLTTPGLYTLKVTPRDDPNTILAQRELDLQKNKIHCIEDIIISQTRSVPDVEVLKEYDILYTNWHQWLVDQGLLPEEYPPSHDNDGDAFSNLEEFLIGTFPNNPYSLPWNTPPVAPSLNSPHDGGEVDTHAPILTINNAQDINNQKLTYEFEVYSGPALDINTRIASVTGIQAGDRVTSWQLPMPFEHNYLYYWRARAYDRIAHSAWMNTATFFVTGSKQEIVLFEGWNLVSFQINHCYYDQNMPAVFIPEGVVKKKVDSLLEWLSNDTNSPIRDASNPKLAGNWQRITSFDLNGAHIIDKDIPPFINTLHYLSAGYGYWIKMNRNGSLMLNGRFLPTNTSLILCNGWNLIGYIPSDTCYADIPKELVCPYTNGKYKDEDGIIFCQIYPPVVSAVFASIDEKYRRIISFDNCKGAMLYDTQLPFFINTLHSLGPQYGYWIKIEGPNRVELIFPGGCSGIQEN